VDDVAVALADLEAGTRVMASEVEVVVRETVPRGHKLALRPIRAGQPVRKYGFLIGYAKAEIAPGAHVHTHNVEAGIISTPQTELCTVAPKVLPLPVTTFQGYRREKRRAGTRNTVAVIATVSCSADPAQALVRRARAELLPQYPNVDDVCAITHDTGCGLPFGGKAYELVLRCLAGMATHPNVAGALILGLGCEVIQPTVVAEAAGRAGVPHHVLTIQEAGGTEQAIRTGLERVGSLLRLANECRRVPLPLSELVVGTECGGSDAYSGITANPVLGLAGDMLIASGAAWVLAETPETYGAEHLLLARTPDPQIRKSYLDKIRWWEEYTASHGASIDNNPAPGNKAGGITTVYEKALGAVAKGGNTPLRDVLGYAAPVRFSGLSFMDTPGMDNVSVTGLAAGGCNLIAFTTGRGSCLAFPAVPVVKIASSSELFAAMPENMDFDAGTVLTGVPMEKAARDLAMLLIATASGRKARGEVLGLGDQTFAPWNLGPTL